MLCKNKMVAHTGSMDKRVKNLSSLQTEITCNLIATNMIFFYSFFSLFLFFVCFNSSTIFECSTHCLSFLKLKIVILAY